MSTSTEYVRRWFEGVADVRDESDRDGMRVVIELRQGLAD